MNLAISNIAWALEQEPIIAKLMEQYGLKGVEIAPTKIWSNPLQATADEIEQYRQFWLNHGIRVVAMQALLYGHPELTIFESPETRQNTLNYLGEIIRLASRLKATALVFGSPKNRRRRNLSLSEAWEIATEFFFHLARIAAAYETIICLEPNPSQYGCDFINTAEQALHLIQEVNHPGLGLQLDAAIMHINQEPVTETIAQSADVLAHFHISEPFLNRVTEGVVNHPAIAASLHNIDYTHWASVEMRYNPEEETTTTIEAVLKFLIDTYKTDYEQNSQ